MNISRKIKRVLKFGTMMILAFLMLFATQIFTPLGSKEASALSNGLALTPPMGWNSWNKYGCNVSESLIRSMADAMVSSGMQAAGYQYVNVDDCWQTGRDGAGNIIADPVKFPNGMKALADYVHSKGLKFGLYTDVGPMTCAGRPGSLNHEVQDANTYASWGVDFVKVDWCYNNGLDAQTQYTIYRDALSNSGRAILFSICNWGLYNPWIWGPATGNMWRTTGDIQDSWSSITSIIDENGPRAVGAGPGAWNDPDMLMVGNYGTGAIGGGGMTDTEYRSHFAMWSIMAAPLIAGNDISNLNQATKDILMNSEVIAVNQDPLGKQGLLKSDINGLQVWSKELSTLGTRAVVLFNRSASAANITVNFDNVGLNATASVRDLWTKTDIGSFTTSYTANVPAHGVVMVKLTGTESNSSGPIISGKTYRIMAKSSGLSLAVYWASTALNTNIIQYGYRATRNDQWVVTSVGGGYYKIEAVHSGMAMAVLNASLVDSANVVQYTYGLAGNDQWQIISIGGGYYKIINKLSGKALNVAWNSPEYNAQMIQYPYSSNNNMSFQFVALN
ncbi:alpha-galactosidase [Cohnella silvisoli]|uniref:Alpha-galactosidase n=1 Tax=Cohnella silvisoli TaxID=2873699 RepID=A0ABV1KLR1_9BACL|nr:alpha-galactosidase [Cohnella silvisoli]MCD9020615.1 alpha-galactosidase [Cohnella silvisoli]